MANTSRQGQTVISQVNHRYLYMFPILLRILNASLAKGTNVQFTLSANKNRFINKSYFLSLAHFSRQLGYSERLSRAIIV